MAVIKNINARQEGGRNYHQSCLTEKLQALRPSTSHGRTVIRFVPEVASDGAIRPMVNAATPAGLDFSNMITESVVISAGGGATRYSGLGRASDQDPDTEDVNLIFPGLFIRLRGMQKRGGLDDLGNRALASHVEKLLAKPAKGSAPLRSHPRMVLAQCVAFIFNDQRLEKPKGLQTIFLTSTAADDIARVLGEAHTKGVDVFGPSDGHAVILIPEKQRGADIKLYTASLGDRIPLSEEHCRKLWCPWDLGLKRLTYAEMVGVAVRCFGREVVELAFPEEVASVLGPSTVQVAQAAPSVAAVAAAPVVAATTKVAENTLQIDMDLSTGPLGDSDTEEPALDTSDALAGFASDAGEAGDMPGALSDPDALMQDYERLLSEDV